jgi:hypothetical protein
MKFIFLGFTLALLAAGCDSTPATDNSETFTKASGTISSATSVANKAAIVLATTFPTNGSPAGLPSLSRSGVYDACSSRTPANPSDIDADGIKTQTSTYDCNGVVDSNSLYTRNGTAIITDADDTNNLSGYKYNYDLTGNYRSTDGKTDINYSYKGYWAMVKNDASYDYQSNYKGKFAGTDTGVTFTTISGGNWLFTLTPTSMTTPYTTGAAEFSGYFAFTFDNQLYVFSTTGTGLKYNASCANFYTEGSVNFVDESANTITVNYGNSTCDAPTLTYNGATI